LGKETVKVTVKFTFHYVCKQDFLFSSKLLLIIVILTVHFETSELYLVSVLKVVCMLVVWHDPAAEHGRENIMKYVAMFVYVLDFEPLRSDGNAGFRLYPTLFI
jgi:hypothetical protein